MPKRITLSLLATLLSIALAACSSGVDWSARERENASHLLASLQFTSEAAGIANAIETPADLDARREELLRALRAAHWNAVQVDDTVLDKLHPQLYARFRMSYQRTLATMIRAYERNDIDTAQNAAAGIVDFMNWYRAQSHTFRWWDEALRTN
jgi:hypothetical protein